MKASKGKIKDPVPSATVILMREVSGSVEVLLVKRNPSLAFLGGKWVFPGGKVDADDKGNDQNSTFRSAAIRELKEETGLSVDKGQLYDYSHWLSPETSPLRFSTRFYVVMLRTDSEVVIDDDEIVDYDWFKPQSAIEKNNSGLFRLSVPAYVSLVHLEKLAFKNGRLEVSTLPQPFNYQPRMIDITGGVCALFAEDDAYQSLDVSSKSDGQHRLMMVGNDWCYQCRL